MTPMEQQAITEFRTAHPDVDDLPDEALLTLLIVQSRVLGLACAIAVSSLVSRLQSDYPPRVQEN